MKRLTCLTAVLGVPSSAWAQSAPDTSHPAGYYLGYLLGLGFVIYSISRIFTGGTKKRM
jgi:hypothetical protein